MILQRFSLNKTAVMVRTLGNGIAIRQACMAPSLAKNTDICGVVGQGCGIQLQEFIVMNVLLYL